MRAGSRASIESGASSTGVAGVNSFADLKITAIGKRPVVIDLDRIDGGETLTLENTTEATRPSGRLPLPADCYRLFVMGLTRRPLDWKQNAQNCSTA